MAALCAALQSGRSLNESVEEAILAGTIQFYKTGIVPVTQEELVQAKAATAG